MYQLLGNFKKAQEIWISQGGLYGLEALNMHVDLMNWSEVLPLAEAYAPHKLPLIHLKTGSQAEQKADYQQALHCIEHENCVCFFTG